MDKWKKRTRPNRLERRFEFGTYDETRNFLDLLAELSESKKIFPDLSFGKTYVNITIRPENEGKDVQLNESDQKFANEINGLLD